MIEESHTMRAECAEKFGAIGPRLKNVEDMVEHIRDNGLPTIDRKVSDLALAVNGKMERLMNRPGWLTAALLGALLSLITALIVYAAKGVK